MTNLRFVAATTTLVVLCASLAGCGVRAGTLQLQPKSVQHDPVYPWRVGVVVEKAFTPFKTTFRYWSSTPIAWSLEGLPDAFVDTLKPHFRSVEPVWVKGGTASGRHDLVARMRVDRIHFDGANTTGMQDRVDLTMTFTIEQPNGIQVFQTTKSSTGSSHYNQPCMVCTPDPSETYAQAFRSVFAQLSEALTASEIRFGVENVSRQPTAATPPPTEVPRPGDSDIEELRKLAESGDARAQSDLGWAYYEGEGVRRNAVEAVKWLRRSAEQGDASGQNRLGVAYQEGIGVRWDYDQAIAWYRRAADQGLVRAQINLALTYNNGIGVRRDYAQAAVWYRKAAEQGDAGAQSDLGVAYANGEGVKKDRREAERWFKKASEQGYAVATFRLAEMYWDQELGKSGVDGRVAIESFEQAAAQGYPLSALRLAEIYTRRTPYNARDHQRACMWTLVARELDKHNEWEERQPDATTALRRKLPEMLARTRRPLTGLQLQECDAQARQWLAAHPR